MTVDHGKTWNKNDDGSFLSIDSFDVPKGIVRILVGKFFVGEPFMANISEVREMADYFKFVADQMEGKA